MTTLRTALLVAVSWALAVPAGAQSAGGVGVQGVLRDASGRPVTGEVTVTLRLFDTADGQGDCDDPPATSGCWWEETRTLTVVDGVLDVVLGDGDPNGLAEVFGRGDARWLEIEPDGALPGPRTPIAAAPWALGAWAVRCQGCIGLSHLADEALVAEALTFDNTASQMAGTDVQSALDELSARLDGGAAVPIGTIIDWYRADAGVPLPEGYAVCDGSVLAEPRSPLDGQTLPDLTDRFTMGVTAERVGEVGGSVESHDHAFSTSTTLDPAGLTEACWNTPVDERPYNQGGSYLPASDVPYHSHTWVFSADGANVPEENQGGPGLDVGVNNSGNHPHEGHGHQVCGPHSHAEHGHSVSLRVDADLRPLPPYIGLLKLMRVY